MQCKQTPFPSFRLAAAAALLCLSSIAAPNLAAAQSAQPAIGPGSTLVHSQFGGQIFGFDIDQNGTEGVLSESQDLGGGLVLAAVETFDQASGNILKVVKKIQTKDDFLTLGIVGTSTGIVEREHVGKLFVAKRIYEVLNPLSKNKFTGLWTPPLTKDDIITQVSRTQGQPNTAFFAFHNGGNDQSFVFESNVAANTVGPLITLTDPVFFFSDSPALAYDSINNRAVVAASTGAPFGPPPVIALVDLAKGTVSEFNGIGNGFVNGLAVDSQDGIACTTTEVDFSVEFYDLKKKTGFIETLPGATNQLQSGSDVEYDPVHKLFFVAQSVSSTAPGVSSIQVYDTKGNLVESLDGFNFSNAFNVIFTHIGLNPSHRSGYVDGPDPGVTEIQSFTY